MGLFSSLFGCGSSNSAPQYPEKIVLRFTGIKRKYSPVVGEYERGIRVYIKQLSDGSFAAYEIDGGHKPYPIDQLRAELEEVDNFLTKYQEERDGV